MNKDFNFTHKGDDYTVEWEEEDKILTLTFSLWSTNKTLTKVGERKIPLLGTIDRIQLEQIVKDYWNSFKRKELN